MTYLQLFEVRESGRRPINEKGHGTKWANLLSVDTSKIHGSLHIKLHVHAGKVLSQIKDSFWCHFSMLTTLKSEYLHFSQPVAIVMSESWRGSYGRGQRVTMARQSRMFHSPSKSLPPPLSSQTKIQEIRTASELPATDNAKPVITNVKLVGSFSWKDSVTPVVMVPGMSITIPASCFCPRISL